MENYVKQAKKQVIVLGTFTLDLAALSLEAILSPLLPVEVRTAPYNQVFQELLNPTSLTMSNHNGYANVLLFRIEDLIVHKLTVTSNPLAHSVLDIAIHQIDELLEAIRAASQSCKIPWVICLCPSNPLSGVDNTRTIHLKQLEIHIQEGLNNIENVYFISSDHISQLYLFPDFHDFVSEQLGNIPYKYDYFCILGYQIARIIYSFSSKPYKVIVLDCDDTLWSGLCGEDGLEGIFILPHQRKLQQSILAQKNSGVLLCLCSKNNEEDVRRIFQSHPDMLLKLEDFVGLKINWKAKSSNISELAHELNLNLDSFIFIDDNPMECAEISSQFPQILTLQLPKEKPEKILSILYHFWPFDHPKVTPEDTRRTLLYQQEAGRLKLKKQSISLVDFIEKLNVTVQLEAVKNGDLARAIQLIKRCNQFNFTQSSEADFLNFLKQEAVTAYMVSVSDRYGEYGESGLILLQVIDNILCVKMFLLSCRVLGKGVEYQLTMRLGKIGEDLQLRILRFFFSESDKNFPAQQFFSHLCELPQSHCGKLDTRRKTVDILVSQSVSIKYKPVDYYEKNKPTTFEISQEEKDKEKILISYATNLGLLENLVEIVKLYQKNKENESRKSLPYFPPENNDEMYLQSVFEKILHIEPIGIDDNFFLLGGSSLLGTLLIAEISQFYAIHITIDCLFKTPTIRKLAQYIHDYKKNNAAQLKLIPAMEREQGMLIPLSFAQQRIWFLDQLHSFSALYNTFIAFHLNGIINEKAIVKSFHALVDRHDSLRTTFLVKSGIPYQIIHPKSSYGFDVSLIDATDLSNEDIRKKAYEIAQTPFDLRTGPLLKVSLLKRDKENYFLFFCSHHIVNDGHSFNILMREFSEFYTLYCRDAESELNFPPPRIQYADFSVWQRAWLEGNVRQNQLTYWTKQLSNLSPLDFPTDFVRSEKTGTEGKRLSFHFDNALLTRLRELSHRANVTLFTSVLSAYAVMLGKYTEKQDIVIGIPVSGRQYPGVENVVGHFINILILRLDLSGDPDFLTLMLRHHKTILDAYKHQDLPFEELVKHLNPDRNISQHPLAQVMLVFQEGDPGIVQLPDICIQKVFSDNDQLLLLADYDHAKLDITMDMQVTPTGLEGLIEYNSYLYLESTVQGIIQHFKNILTSVCNNPERPYSALSIFDINEYRKILLEWNNTTTPYPRHSTVACLFEERAQTQPDKIAVSFYDEHLTYRTLNRKANQLAYFLQTKNIRAQTLVILFLNRSIDLVVSILAIFKIGAVCVPLSPDLPKEYTRSFMKDAQANYVLTHQSLYSQAKEWFHEHPYLNVLVVDTLVLPEQTEEANRLDANLLSRITPHHIAAMIYTSGSTGQPKGVLLKHQGLTNTICTQINYLNITPENRVMQVASINFDAALWDIFGALVAGAQLYLLHQEDIFNTNRFAQILQEKAISLMTVTPSYLSTLPARDLPDLKTIVVVGESCPLSLVKQWAKGRQFVNAYGPTEASICATMDTLLPDAKIVTIGRPIANTRIYVLSQERQPMPVGMTGEVYIAGDGIAQGYHQRNELNAQHFLPDPFSENPEDKMYKTGDRARWLTNACLEYMGRNDELVKIRGIRTELSAVTAALQTHPLVNQAVVVWNDNPHNQRLLAYLVLSQGNNDEGSDLVALNHQHITHWQLLYNDLYGSAARELELQTTKLTTEGWESSYTHHPIAPEEMMEWIKSTVDRILALSPKKILEIGCGNGLLMQSIAPVCSKYLATDFSQYALDILKNHCNVNLSLQHVDVEKRSAHEFSEKDKNGYDTIIMNSVIQYFPNVDYLINVLDQCISAVQSPGQIYIGDIRNLKYQAAFHSDVQYYKLKKNPHASELTFAQWQQQVQSQIACDPELVISEHFFRWYAERNPKITHATIELRRGIFNNEMNAFRYDVVLHIGKPVISHIGNEYAVDQYDWQKNRFDLNKISKQCSQQGRRNFIIRNVPNKRVDKAILLKNIPALESNQPALPTIDDYLKVHLDADKSVDPEVFWHLGEQFFYHVHISFSKEQENCMDIIFIHKNNAQNAHELLNCITNALPPLPRTNASYQYTDDANWPMNMMVTKLLTKKMQEFLRPLLPSHMIPAAFIGLNKMPLTPNGKVDKSALPNADLFFTQAHHRRLIGAEDRHSDQLRKMFSNILHLAEDHISEDDSFFDIGGHSLLAIKLIREIEDVFHIEFSIRDLFKASSINEIMAVIKAKSKKPVSGEVNGNIILS